MSEQTQYQHGTFCWPELIAHDLDAAKKFYTAFFDWGTNEMPTGEGQVYVMAQVDGKNVGAMYKMMPEQREQGIPSNWLSYFSVDNVDEVAKKVSELGGTVMHGPADVPEAGRMALCLDPQGAAFALWQAGNHIGAQLINQHATLSWNECAVKDRKAGRDFYTQLFGWTSQDQDMGPNGIYTTFLNDGNMTAGLFELTEEMEGIPPHWMIYFAVDDCDAMAEKATSLGASLHVPPTDIPDIGRFSVVEDPQGAVFSIIQLAPMP